MLRIRSIAVWSAAALMIVYGSGASLVRAADVVDSPRYQAWSKFKVGSSHTLSGTMNGGAVPVQTEMTQKLVELTDDHVTIETTATTTVMGRSHTMPPRSQSIPAKEEMKDVTELGNEKVDAMGKTFDCKVYEITKGPPVATGRPTQPNQESGGKAKIWVSPEVPGGVVKLEATGHSANPSAGEGGTITMTYLLKSYEAK
jgi:hypothetical protein